MKKNPLNFRKLRSYIPFQNQFYDFSCISKLQTHPLNVKGIELLFFSLLNCTFLSSFQKLIPTSFYHLMLQTVPTPQFLYCNLFFTSSPLFHFIISKPIYPLCFFFHFLSYCLSPFPLPIICFRVPEISFYLLPAITLLK